MCISAATALAALSAAATVAGTVSSNNAQKSQMRNYNNQVNQQNRLLEQQYADRQKKTYAARDEQAKVFNEIATAQDAEFAKQQELAKQKQKVFQEALQQPAVGGDQTPLFEGAVAKRNQLFTDTGGDLPGSYGSTDGATENRVIRQAAEKAKSNKAEKTSGIIGSLSRMSAYQDVDQQQGELFRDLNLDMGDVASEARGRSRLLDFKLRPSQAKMGALGASIGETTQAPYFRGTEPIYTPPDTTFSDILSGAGQLGMDAYFQGAFDTPATGAVVPAGAKATGPFGQPAMRYKV